MSHLGIEDTVWWAFKRCPLNKSQWLIVAYYTQKKRWDFLVFSTYFNIFHLQEKRNDAWQCFQVPFQTNIEVSPPEGIALPSSTISSITSREDSANTMVVHLLTCLFAFQLHFWKLTWIPKRGLPWNMAIFDIYIYMLNFWQHLLFHVLLYRWFYSSKRTVQVTMLKRGGRDSPWGLKGIMIQVQVCNLRSFVFRSLQLLCEFNVIKHTVTNS